MQVYLQLDIFAFKDKWSKPKNVVLRKFDFKVKYRIYLIVSSQMMLKFVKWSLKIE